MSTTTTPDSSSSYINRLSDIHIPVLTALTKYSMRDMQKKYKTTLKKQHVASNQYLTPFSDLYARTPRASIPMSPMRDCGA